MTPKPTPPYFSEYRGPIRTGSCKRNDRTCRHPTLGGGLYGKPHAGCRSTTQLEFVTRRQLQLGLYLRDGIADCCARGKNTGDVQPFGQQLPMFAHLVRPRESPTVSVLVARGTKKSAQLMSMKIVKPCGEPIPRPLEAGQRVLGAELHKEL